MRHARFLTLCGIVGVGCNSEPMPVVDLVVDSNRSGLLEPGDPTEDADENTWDGKHGAVFLANLDDDDKDGKADAQDEIVNGAADIADLSPIVLRPWPQASLKSSGTFGIDAASAPNVRLFRVNGPADDPSSYTVVADPTKVTLTAAELVAGAQFAIEGRTFLKSTDASAWNGKVQLSLSVTDPMVTNEQAKTMLSDAAVLRVAPVLFQFNTAPVEKLFHSNAGQYTELLAAGLVPVAEAAKTTVEALALADYGLEQDVWAQDFFDLAYTSKPGPGGKPIGIKIAVRSAQPDRSAGEITTARFFGPDWAVVFEHLDNAVSNHSYSMNSFGNYDVIPPYEKGADKYPVGRNFYGRTEDPRQSPDSRFQDFVIAQAVQPVVTVDTSWLAVGHVDEFTSWVKSNSPRGWAMLRSSPRDARTMLQTIEGMGMGATQMFVGKVAYDWNKRKNVPAAIAVTAVLGDANLMASSQSSQAKVDSESTKLVNEIGLQANEVMEMPFLYDVSFGEAVAYQPGTVNLLYADGAVLLPDPFGPIINGADPFKEDLKTRLGAIGLQVFFVDDWDTFHEGEGEVHCGTNAVRDMKLKWWESGR